MKKLKIIESECSCKICSSMCRAPCSGTLEDIEKLMNFGYGNRLMLDDLPGGPDVLKPALKGYEGKRAPWEVYSEKGCTFWKNGKCELHSLGLKPIQGKLAHHSLNRQQNDEIQDYIRDVWESEEVCAIIEKWKQENHNYEKE